MQTSEFREGQSAYMCQTKAAGVPETMKVTVTTITNNFVIASDDVMTPVRFYSTDDKRDFLADAFGNKRLYADAKSMENTERIKSLYIQAKKELKEHCAYDYTEDQLSLVIEVLTGKRTVVSSPASCDRGNSISLFGLNATDMEEYDDGK